LRPQCIPEGWALWMVLHYDEFVEARERLLTDSMNKYLGV
jgi:hypothetical protein